MINGVLVRTMGALAIGEVEQELSYDQHSISWTATGYKPLYCEVTVSDMGIVCDSVEGGACNSEVPPGVTIVPGDVTKIIGYLEAETGGYAAWKEEKGGAAGLLGNMGAINELIFGYYGLAELGFTVTMGDVNDAIFCYYGLIT